MHKWQLISPQSSKIIQATDMANASQLFYNHLKETHNANVTDITIKNINTNNLYTFSVHKKNKPVETTKINILNSSQKGGIATIKEIEEKQKIEQILVDVNKRLHNIENILVRDNNHNNHSDHSNHKPQQIIGGNYDGNTETRNNMRTNRYANISDLPPNNKDNFAKRTPFGKRQQNDYSEKNENGSENKHVNTECKIL